MSSKKILIGGAGGFVGSKLVRYFSDGGWDVFTLSRIPSDSSKSEDTKKIFWDVEKGILNPKALSGFDAVISLAGENIFSRWNKEKKEKILSSRIKSAETIARAISLSENPPSVFLCASAIGYYGAAPVKTVDEQSSCGSGFLAEVCSKWEKSAKTAASERTRVISARFGIVIGHSGGILALFDKFARFKIVPIIGYGKNKMSWISISDLCRATEFCLDNQSLSGAVNFTSPNSCTNEEFSRACAENSGSVLLANIPPFVVRILMGEAADALALSDISAFPSKLVSQNFEFEDTEIKKAVLRQP